MGFDWDKNGNMVYMHDGSDAWNYTYDLEDRLTSVRKNGALQSRFWYDADGRRVKLWDSQNGYMTHVYSGLDVIYESSSSGVTKHFYANGLHVAEVKPGGGSVVTEYYHHDHLGSTRLKTDADGDVVFTRNYEPFGPDYDGSGSEEFKYTGKHEDPSGLYYFGARYYDPEIGRFITEDPVLGSLEDPQSLNRYTYCRNNPHKYVDPDGEFAFTALAFSAFVGGIIGSVVSMTSYAAVKTVTREKITAGGIISAGASGFVSGAVSVLAGPIAGTAVKGLGASSAGLAAKTISYIIQAVADVGSYWLESRIKNEEFELKEAAFRGVVSFGFSAGTDYVLPDTIGMSTLEQAKHWTPATSDAYYGVILGRDLPNVYNAKIITKSVAIGTFTSSIADPWIGEIDYLNDW